MQNFEYYKTVDEFIETHGGYWNGECPEALWKDWMTEVSNRDTRQGYWEWAYAVTEGE
jgi:hypothetical protein